MYAFQQHLANEPAEKTSIPAVELATYPGARHIWSLRFTRLYGEKAKLAREILPGRQLFQKVITSPPATISDPPTRIGVVGCCPNRTFATICATRKNSAT